MSTPKGTNSILLLALRILPHVKLSIGNLLIPIIGGLMFGYAFYGESDSYHEICKKILEAILQFDGAVLGLILAVFGIYGTVESNQRTLFAITKGPEGSRISFFKLKLITVFKMCFWVFTCSSFLLTIYSLISIKEHIPLVTEILMPKFRYAVLAFLISSAQIKILIELKVYVFSMYQRALTEARAYAVEQSKTPFDSSID